MKKIIYIRDSPVWKNMNEDLFLNQSFKYNQLYWDKLLAKIFPQVKFWNQLSLVSYFDYREELKQITLKNVSRINGDFKYVNDEDDLPNESFIFLSVDDDDWYHPEIINVIQSEIKEDTDFVCWDNLYITKNGNIKFRSSYDIVTNNYAFTKNGYKKMKLLENSIFHPCYWVKDQIKVGNFNIKNISKILSATNKTLASATVLDQYPDKEKFLKEFSKIRTTLLKEPIWASEETNLMNKLNKNTFLNNFY